MEVRKLVAAEPRVESGAIQFGRDWPGLFIRGDNAFDLSQRLKLVFKSVSNLPLVDVPPVITELIRMLDSVVVDNKPKNWKDG